MNGKKERFPQESEGLGSRRVLGVNDRMALIVETFEPTRHELSLLVEHYYREARSNLEFYEATGQTGTTEIRELAFARRRLATLEDALGESDYQAAIDAAKKKEERASQA